MTSSKLMKSANVAVTFLPQDHHSLQNVASNQQPYQSKTISKNINNTVWFEYTAKNPIRLALLLFVGGKKCARHS